jgi:indolepyruvate ferredoxin oxidoreductase
MLLLGCDIVVAVSDDALSKTAAGRTHAIVNSGRTITGDFIRNPDSAFPESAMERSIIDAVGAGAATFIDAGRLATRLMGHSIATNIFMLGYAFQRGHLPLSSTALLRAIELNGAAVEENRRAFDWGRRAALDPAGVEALAAEGEPRAPTHRLSTTLNEIMERRHEFLVAYQDRAYADRYLALVDRVRRRAEKLGAGGTALTEAVARNYFKLLAYKDEYEVARLFTAPDFQRALDSGFEGGYRLRFHVSLPWSRATQPGESPKKIPFGPWLMPVMKLLARGKFLRGTPFDPFGRIDERLRERELIGDYERDIDTLLDGLAPATLDTAVALAGIPEMIRGFGPVKRKSIAQALARRQELLRALAPSGDSAAKERHAA